MTRMPGTTLAVTKRAIVDALTTRLAGVAGMEQIEVFYSIPTKDSPPSEGIWFDDDSSSDVTWRWMQAGTKPMREQWETTLHIQALRKRGDITAGQDAGEQAELRVLAIWAQVQQLIAEDPQVHESLLWAEFDGFELNISRESALTKCRMEITIRGEAELFPDP